MEALNYLVQHAVYAVVARKSDAQLLANIAYGAALTLATLSQPDTQLIAALARQAERHVDNFNP